MLVHMEKEEVVVAEKMHEEVVVIMQLKDYQPEKNLISAFLALELVSRVRLYFPLLTLSEMAVGLHAE